MGVIVDNAEGLTLRMVDYKSSVDELNRMWQTKQRELDALLEEKRKIDGIISTLYAEINDIHNSIQAIKRVENDKRQPTFTI